MINACQIVGVVFVALSSFFFASFITTHSAFERRSIAGRLALSSTDRTGLAFHGFPASAECRTLYNTGNWKVHLFVPMSS